jgi:hypothetical protein
MLPPFRVYLHEYDELRDEILAADDRVLPDSVVRPQVRTVVAPL